MRPEILFPLFAPVTALKGVGPRVAPLLEKVAGPIVRDMLWLQPHSLVRRTPAVLAAARDGEIMTFEVTILEHLKPRSHQQPWRVRASDDTALITLVFFGRFAYQLEKRHPVGAKRIISGKVRRIVSASPSPNVTL